MAGRVLLHYTVIQEFDLGPFGRVIKSMDMKTNKLAALKFPPRDFLADFVMRKAEWKKFVDDMNIAQAIQHPSLCNVSESNEFNGEFFYATDYVEGVSLKDLIDTQIPPPKICLTIAEKVLQVFDIYHPKEIVIGVLRADHILLSTDGHIKLLDLPSIRLKDFASLHDDDDHLLSLSYQSPEFLKKESSDDRSDLYSLGVIMFHTLTGQLPFSGKTMDELIYAIMYKDAPQVSDITPAVPAEISLVVKRMLSKNPAWRYKHAADLIAELKRLKTTIGNADEMKEKKIAETIGSLVPMVQKRLEQHPLKPPSYRREILHTVVIKQEPAAPDAPSRRPESTEGSSRGDAPSRRPESTEGLSRGDAPSLSRGEPPRQEAPRPTVSAPAAPRPEPPRPAPPEPPAAPPSPAPEQSRPQKYDMFTDDLIRVAEEEARKAASFGIDTNAPSREQQYTPPAHHPFQPPAADRYQPAVTPPPGAELPHLPTVEEFIVPPIAEGETEERKLSSIVFTDIRGFSKKMGENETIAMRVLQMHNSIMESLFAKYGGKVIKSIGDAYMVDFSSAVNGVRCAVEAQERLWEYNRSQMTELERVFVRIGIHMGDVVIKGDDIFGDAVNIAARIESISEAGRITITADVYQQVRNKMSLDVMYLGKRLLKNIQEPVEVYQIMLNTIPETLPTTEDLRRARAMEEEERRRQEEDLKRREEDARRQSETQERRKRELEDQRRAEEELRRRRAEEVKRRKDEEVRMRRQEEERLAALHKAVAACLQAANNHISSEQFDKAAEELSHAYTLDPGNEDIRLMENRLRIAQEESRMRKEEMQRRMEEERLRHETEDARRKAEEEAQRVAIEEERRRKEEQERREMQLKKIAEYLDKGELFLRDADFEKARNELSRIYILDPGNAAARIFEAKIKDFESKVAREREQRESQRRAEEEEVRRKRERENQIQMFIVRAQDLFRKHRYDEAIDEIVRIYAIDPENAQAHQWEGKIRVAQESHQRTADMNTSIPSESDSDAGEEIQALENEVYEKPTVDTSTPSAAPVSTRKWLIIGIAAAAVVLVLAVVAGPLFHALFPKDFVVVVQPFTTNDGTGTGEGLAVLAAGDLGVLQHMTVVDPISSAYDAGSSPQTLFRKYGATHLITGNVRLVKNQADVTITIQDSTAVISTFTVSGSLEALPQLRIDIRSAIAEAFNVSESSQDAQPMTSTGKPEAIRKVFEGISYTEIGRYNLAIAAFDSAILADPKFADAYGWLAGILLDSCEILGNANNEVGARALDVARRSIDLNPESPDGYADLAIYNRLMGNFPEARASALKALQLSPSNAAANAELAIASLVFHDMKSADEHAENAARLGPYQYRVWLASALTNHYQRRYRQAVESYQRALEVGHSRTYETTTVLMADAMHRAELNDLAIKTYNGLLSKEPGDYFIEYRIARVYQGMGKRSEGDKYLAMAQKNAAAALAKSQDDAQARMVYGLTLMRLGRFNDGFAEVQRVANTNPENPTFLYALARAYAIYHKDKEAFDALAKAIAKEYRISSVLDLDLFNLESDDQYEQAITLQDVQH